MLMCNMHEQIHNNNKAYDSFKPPIDSGRYRNSGVQFDKIDLTLPLGVSYQGPATFIITGPDTICLMCDWIWAFFNHNSKCLNSMLAFVNVCLWLRVLSCRLFRHVVDCVILFSVLRVTLIGMCCFKCEWNGCACFDCLCVRQCCRPLVDYIHLFIM